MTIIRTSEFALRPLKLSDAKAYLEVMQDADTKRNLNSAPANIVEAKQEITKYLDQAKKYGSKNFTIEMNSKYAGNIILQPQDWDKKTCDGRIHLWIHPDYRGKGLASKALDAVINYAFQKGYKRIFAQHKAINKGVFKLMQRLDFKKVKEHSVDGVKKILWVKEKK